MVRTCQKIKKKSEEKKGIPNVHASFLSMRPPCPMTGLAHYKECWFAYTKSRGRDSQYHSLQYHFTPNASTQGRRQGYAPVLLGIPKILVGKKVCTYIQDSAQPTKAGTSAQAQPSQRFAPRNGSIARRQPLPLPFPPSPALFRCFVLSSSPREPPPPSDGASTREIGRAHV